MHRTTIDEFERMIEADVFGVCPDVRIELVSGTLWDVAKPSPMHDEIVTRLAEWAHDERDGRFRVRSQQGIQLPELDSIPLPDMTWVRRRNYERRRPHAEDVLLIVEVSDSSLAYDRDEKAKLYAAAGLQDYWIVNIPQRCVEVFREPTSSGYRSAVAVELSDKVRPLAFPTIALSVAKLFEQWGDE